MLNTMLWVVSPGGPGITHGTLSPLRMRGRVSEETADSVGCLSPRRSTSSASRIQSFARSAHAREPLSIAFGDSCAARRASAVAFNSCSSDKVRMSGMCDVHAVKGQMPALQFPKFRCLCPRIAAPVNLRSPSARACGRPIKNASMLVDPMSFNSTGSSLPVGREDALSHHQRSFTISSGSSPYRRQSWPAYPDPSANASDTFDHSGPLWRPRPRRRLRSTRPRSSLSGMSFTSAIAHSPSVHLIP